MRGLVGIGGRIVSSLLYRYAPLKNGFEAWDVG